MQQTPSLTDNHSVHALTGGSVYAMTAIGAYLAGNATVSVTRDACLLNR